jgi:hypothetical protein
MIFASAVFYGFMPKIAELLGMHALAAAIYQLHASGWGLAVYGLLVFLMEFLPFGAVNPPEVSEYFTMVSRPPAQHSCWPSLPQGPQLAPVHIPVHRLLEPQVLRQTILVSGRHCINAVCAD